MLFGFLELAVGLWWISLPLVMHVLIALGFGAKRLGMRNIILAASPYIFPVAITIFGDAFRHNGTSADAPQAPIVGAWVLYLIQLLLCAYTVYVNRGARWFTVASSLLALWLGFLGLFMAQMALTNVWL